LEWRQNNVVVASRDIRAVTFDELLEDLYTRLANFLLAADGGGCTVKARVYPARVNRMNTWDDE